jgi:hypothetical protein
VSPRGSKVGFAGKRDGPTSSQRRRALDFGDLDPRSGFEHLPPYGYRSAPAADGKGWTLEPVDETAAVVRRIFADATEGDTPGRIADALNRDSIPGPRGGTWNRTAVSAIIENVAYAGERYGMKGAHPAIVSRRVWNAANAELEEARAALRRRASSNGEDGRRNREATERQQDRDRVLPSGVTGARDVNLRFRGSQRTSSEAFAVSARCSQGAAIDTPFCQKRDAPLMNVQRPH